MTITKTQENTKLIIALEGRLDTTTAPALEKELNESYDSISSLELDFAKLDYISSAGLRVILAAQKVMGKKDGMVICNVNAGIMEVFEITGFEDILTIR